MLPAVLIAVSVVLPLAANEDENAVTPAYNSFPLPAVLFTLTSTSYNAFELKGITVFELIHSSSLPLLLPTSTTGPKNCP